MAGSMRGVAGAGCGLEGLPVFIGAEDVVSFQEPGEEEEDGHDAGGPGEDKQREGLGEGGVWGWLGFAEDDASDQRDSGGDSK